MLFAVAMAMAGLNMSAALKAPGQYYIQNVSTGKYVVLQNSQLADVTANESGAEVINLDYTLDATTTDEAIITTLNSDNGDMIATLNFIKESFEMVLESEDMPTDFLDEMFTLHIASTGDADESVYLRVDVPEIENWEEIRDYLLETANGQQAVTYYLTHMVPGASHYLGVDYDDSFGFRLQAGDDCKWILHPVINTAISEVKTVEANSQAYDLLGRPVSNPSGLYIQDGRLHVK